jgi:hypothetical protein
MSDTFDTLFPPGSPALDGAVAKFEIVDPDGTPNRVLEITREWKVNVEWHLWGSGVDCLGGTWHVQVSLESMGAGFEGLVDPVVDVPYADWDLTKSTPTHCHWVLPKPILITPNEMKGKGINPGIFKPTLLITYSNSAGNNRPMAGFSEGNLITLYDPD